MLLRFYKMNIHACVLLCLLLAACNAKPPTPTPDLSLQLDELFKNWSNETPGGVLTIQKGDQIIYDKAFGLANLEYAIPNTTSTIFETGSVAKQITAAAILLLALDGKLSLDDEVQRFLPEFPRYGYKMTIRHLLYHTSGVRDWGAITAISGWERGTRVHTNAHVLDILMHQNALNFPPGDQYNYSNSNYNLLAMIAERASKQNFAQFTSERIFKPLGMTHSQWRDDFRKIVKNRATAYNRYGKKYLLAMPFEQAYGHSGLLTTTSDLLKWNQNYKTGKVGGKAFLKLQLEQGCLNNGLEIAYAAGVFIRQYRDVLEISHSGSTAGYRAWLAYYPYYDVSVAFMSNDGSANVEKIGAQVAELVLGKKLITPIPKVITLNHNSLRHYEGRYKSVRDDRLFELEVQEGGLYLKGYQTMLPTTPYTFHWGASRMEFSKDLQRVFVFTGNGDSVTFVRKDPMPLPLNALPQYLGTYHSTEAETSYQIERSDKQLQVFQRPSTFYLLQSIYSDAFINPKNQLFQFQRDTTGIITGFKISTERAQGIWFEKDTLSRLPVQ